MQTLLSCLHLLIHRPCFSSVFFDSMTSLNVLKFWSSKLRELALLRKSKKYKRLNYDNLRYQPPLKTVHARIAVALVVFIKTPINHIFFKSLIIPDCGFELTETIYLNVFRNWNALCKSTRLYKSCSTPAGNKRKKTMNTAFASQHVPLKNRVSVF